uniref:AMP-dependent synthetase/ligase domain-containing protein n=2 Tax=Chlamydomonas euryale TaxID=1486919 RepID=A0A7R9Z2J4_9CHLO|mmetsp:Transcript_40686/g.121353  ORF Transcript_40686/g.121353 Transcript_40686/m.121353 type:complete len:283 (+) Transcript_40686:156-1004(+)
MAPQQRYESKFSALQEVQPARPAQGERPAAGPVYQASYVDPNQDTGVVQGCSTLLETFERSVGLYGDRPCLGHRPIGPDGKVGPFVFTTYAETSAIVSNVAAAYQHMGLVAKDTVGIIGSNCPEWMSAMLAMNKCSIVCVPLYDTLGDKAVEYIVNHAETKLIVASGKKLATLAPALETTKSIVTKGVVYWGKPDTEAIERIKALGLAVRSWDQLVAEGADATGLPAPTAPKPADLCTIMYTSGTTGNPKGVMISHRAVVATIGGILRYLDFLGEKMGPNDA